MLLNLYSVLDNTSNLYLPPFAMRTDKEAIEAFAKAVNSPESIWKKYPDDYALVRLGNFDDESAVIQQPEPGLVITAKKVIQPDS